MHFTHQATCDKQRFLQTLVQAPVIRIQPSYQARKGIKVPVWLHRVQLKTSGREKCCWKGRRKNGMKCEGPWCYWTFFTVSDWHVAAPCITHRCCKQVTLYSGFIQHQSSSLLFFRVRHSPTLLLLYTFGRIYTHSKSSESKSKMKHTSYKVTKVISRIIHFILKNTEGRGVCKNKK